MNIFNSFYSYYDHKQINSMKYNFSKVNYNANKIFKFLKLWNLNLIILIKINKSLLIF
jgi:hypothetical protein